MHTRKSHASLLTTGLVLFILLLSSVVHAQITPLGDSYTNSADPTTNYGAKTLLDVDGATQYTYIQFDLASIPSGASVSQATLKLYVNSVTTAGSFNVDYVNGSWTEGTITWNSSPALGTTIASNVSVTTADKNQYILVNVTPAVQAWLSGSEANDGIALVANSTFNATFDSKENTGTSHPPELDIVFASGTGTITGVTTSSSSGLTGGGTTGTLNLSLLTSCSANQTLEWSGSAWACSSAGAGTVTGITAGTGISVTGSAPSPTVGINTSVVPQLGAANTFTGNQTVNGNLSATGVVSGGSYQIGSNPFAFGSVANGNAFLGFAGNSSTNASWDTAIGFEALGANTTGSNNTASGGGALYSNTMGNYNTASGYNALYAGTTGSYNTANGFSAGGIPPDNTKVTGGQNTFLGAQTVPSTGSLNNATAIGANAEVGESNALVLGSINGVNNATASVNVGIGTTTPAYSLDVNGTGRFTTSSTTGFAIDGTVTSSSPSHVFGVYGNASNSDLGVGVFGQQGSGESSTGQSLAHTNSAGVWGDGGTTNTGESGIIGTTDDGTAAVFMNNTSNYAATTVYIQSQNTAPFPFIAGYGSTMATLSTWCDIDSSGNINCTGAKHAVVPVDGGTRMVALSAIESPKNWFEDFGSAQLVNGSAVVALDPTFIQTVDSEQDYKVFPVPNGDCKGLYVTNKTATSFEVRELGGGTSSVSFDYRITALRKNYENVRFEDHTKDMDSMKLMSAQPGSRSAQPQSHDPEKKLMPTPARAATLKPAAVVAKPNH